MTGGALDAFWPLCELAVVFVFMAVSALGEGKLFLKVAFEVTCFALDRLVFSHQRVLGLRVIEGVAQSRCRDTFPTACVMAGGASFVLEAALVRIGVAVVALTERKAFISRRALSVGRVALLAFHFLVKSGQRVTRFAVIEFPGSILPVDEVVALDAILAEAAFVKILVACSAGLRDPEESLAEILHLDGGALGRGNFVGRVALVAGEASVLAFEHVARFFVIELVGVPLDEREIQPIVIGMAANALLAGAGRNVIRGVQSALGGDARADVGVATNAFEFWLPAADFVAVGAVGSTVEVLMGACEWARRNLRGSMSGQENETEE